MENEVKASLQPSAEQVKVFASRFNISLEDGTQEAGVVGSLVDLLEGRGTLPAWMVDEPCFAALVAERAGKEPEV